MLILFLFLWQYGDRIKDFGVKNILKEVKLIIRLLTENILFILAVKDHIPCPFKLFAIIIICNIKFQCLGFNT